MKKYLCIFLLFCFLIQLTGIASQSFIQAYEQFLVDLRQKITQTNTSEQYNQLMKWKDRNINILIEKAPPAGQRKGEDLRALGHLFQLKGDSQKAASFYENSLMLQPGHVATIANLMALYVKSGFPEQAGKIYFSHEKYLPEGRKGHYLVNLAEGFFDAGKYERSNDFLRMALDKYVPDAYKLTLIRAMAQNYVLAGQKESAMSFLMETMAQNRQWATKLQDTMKQMDLLQRPAPLLDMSHWVNASQPSLMQMHGKVIILDFWALWCPDCLSSMEHLRTLYTGYHEAGLEIISITIPENALGNGTQSEKSISDTYGFQQLSDFVTENEYPWYFGLASSDANHVNYAIKSIPHFTLIDKKGIIRYIESGKTPDFSKIQSIADKLMAE